MRSLLITAAVLAALVAGFVVFLLTQKSTVPVVKRAKRPPASLPVLHEGVTGGPAVGGGEGGWVQSFDKKSGELINEFRADHFDPPVNNRVHVIRPDARFYDNKNGQVLTLSAATGDITMAESAKKGDRLGSMQGQPPSHGTLYDVKLGLLESPEADTPVLTCTLPIVAFDNDTLRLNTVSMTKDGQDIPPDRIPVTVRGRDYDFDGQGLTVRYNQRDRRLEFLEVAHGQRLVIKNTKAFGPTTQPLGQGPLMLDGRRPIELASADAAEAPKLSAEERERRRKKRDAATRKAAREHKAATKPVKPASTRPHEIVAYRATFADAVTITEAGVPVGDADRMVATFTSEQNASTTRPTTKPTVAPAAGVPATTAPARRRRPTTTPAAIATVQPSTQPTSRRTRRATTSATTLPATAPSPAGPIEIRWTGKLTVVPQKLAEAGLRSSADRIVEFTGKPVHLQRQGSTIVAAYVWAAVDGNRFRAAPDATTPMVTLTDPRGTVLTTEAIDADGDDAILHGKSNAKVVLSAADTPAGQPPGTMLATWTDFATLRTKVGPTGQRDLERAVFRGNVDVRHPQLKLTSDTLALGFTPPTAKPADGKAQSQLSAVRADGKVKAAVTNDDGTTQTITSATLELGTAAAADGTLAVRSLHANGDVVAADPKQILRTDDLATTLSAEKPATASTLAVDTLTATGHVEFANADGAKAFADKLTVEKVSGVQWLTLYGNPARVADPQSGVTGAGNVIRTDTANRAAIDGPGTFSGVGNKSADGKPGQPVNVSWSKSMQYDAGADAARVTGDVVVTSRGTDGTVNTANGQTLDIVFADTRTTQPATAKPPATQALGFGGGTGKPVKSLTLREIDPKLGISSLLYSPTEPTKIIRQTYLWAPAVTIDVNPDGTVGAMDVPSGGTAFYEDVTPATKPAATAPATRPLGGQGAVAIEWVKQLHYDAKAQQALIDGNVTVVRRAPGQDETTMLAPRLIADLAGDAGPQGGQLKRMVADQGATLLGNKMRVDAARAVYEPAADRLIATGTPRQPVQWHDEGGMSRGSFAELWWNLKTNQPEKVKDVSVEMNR